MELGNLYLLGTKLQYIKRCKSLHPLVKEDTFLLYNLNIINDILEKFNLSLVTQTEIKKLIDRLDKSYDKEQHLSSEDEDSIFEATKLWDDRIINELDNRVTIEVFMDGTLNYKKMIQGGKSFFPEEVWNSLSEISKSDLNDTCNCLLTRSWTPAVMISLRASEDCIRKLFNRKTGKNSGKLGWKKILDALEKTPDMDHTLIGYLNYIREMRNAAEHPDEIFDQMEAERVFHQVVNVIIVIHKELKKTEDKSEDGE